MMDMVRCRGRLEAWVDGKRRQFAHDGCRSNVALNHGTAARARVHDRTATGVSGARCGSCYDRFLRHGHPPSSPRSTYEIGCLRHAEGTRFHRRCLGPSTSSSLVCTDGWIKATTMVVAILFCSCPGSVPCTSGPSIPMPSIHPYAIQPSLCHPSLCHSSIPMPFNHPYAT